MFSRFPILLHIELRKILDEKKRCKVVLILFEFWGHVVVSILPIFLALKFLPVFEDFKTVHSEILQIIVILAYLMTVFPFIILTYFFERKLNKWNKLREPKFDKEILPLNSKRNQPVGVDVIQPDQSWTNKNKGLILDQHKKLVRSTDK